MNNELRTLAFERAPTNKIRKAALAGGMKSLLADGRLKVSGRHHHRRGNRQGRPDRGRGANRPQYVVPVPANNGQQDFPGLTTMAIHHFKSTGSWKPASAAAPSTFTWPSGKPPTLRLHGHLRELQTKVLDAEDTHVADEVHHPRTHPAGIRGKGQRRLRVRLRRRGPLPRRHLQAEGRLPASSCGESPTSC